MSRSMKWIAATALLVALYARSVCAQDLFISYDTANGTVATRTIEKITPSGVISKFATLSMNTGVPVSSLPPGNHLAFDRFGNLYTNTYDTIYRYAPDGTQSVFATVLEYQYEIFGALAFDSAGNLYVSGTDQRSNGAVLQVTPSGVVSLYATLHGPGLPTLEPNALAFDSAGNLYGTIYNASGSGILKIAPNGSVSAFVTTGLNNPYGLAIDWNDNLYVANEGSQNISMITPTGVVSSLASIPTADLKGLTLWRGNLYAADAANDKVIRITKEGMVTAYPTGGVPVSDLVFKPVPPRADINGDGNADLVFQNSLTGEVAFWFMNSADVLGSALMSTPLPEPGYQVVGVADFNGDGHPDLVFQNQTSGQIVLWYLNGSQYAGGAAVARIPSPGYQIVGIGDFNGDGLPDLLFQNQTTGQLAVWYMNDTTFLGGTAITEIPEPGYQVVGVADFNGDGQPDIVFQNQTTGQIVVWYMNGVTQIGGTAISPTPYPGWFVRAVDDFNHDSSPDFVFQNPMTGAVVIWYMTNADYQSGAPANRLPDPNYLIAGPR